MKNPTNSDLLREIKEINRKLEAYGHDISELKEWKIAVEAAKQALKEYQMQHPTQTDDERNNSSVIKALIAVTATIAVLGGVIVVLANR